MQTKPSILIIGAGIGGLSAAAHLAQQGFKVTVLEKNQRAGGRCDHFTHDGHRFDTGPTLLIMPLIYEAEFAALGASFRDRLDLRRVDPTYHVVFDDGNQLTLTSDLKRMYDQLEAMEPGGFQGLLRYLQEGEQHYEVGVKSMVQKDFRTAAEFFSVGNLPLLLQLKPLAHHYRHMAKYFTTPRLKSAFTFQDSYMGMSPFEAPATFSMMPYTELVHGIWYPIGGMYRIAEVLVDIAREAGVEFIFDAEVQRIEVADDRVTGVVCKNNQHYTADIVIANADLPYVYQALLPEDRSADELEHKSFSCSTISFFWGVDKVYDALGPHMLFLSDDYRENFESIIHGLTLPDNPCVYLHTPARLDRSAAPGGEDTLIAVVPVGHLDERSAQDWIDIRDRARKAVLRRLELLGIHDLPQHIKFEINYTPLSWRKRYNLLKGATHGLAHTVTQMGYLRPHNRHDRYHNLSFVGASTPPGTGIPTAMVSGRLSAQRIMDDLHAEKDSKSIIYLTSSVPK